MPTDPRDMTPDELLHELREEITRQQLRSSANRLAQVFDELDYRLTEQGAPSAPSDWRI